MSEHRHRTPLRGTEVVPRPKPDNPDYSAVNYRYAGVLGHIHEVVEIGGRELATDFRHPETGEPYNPDFAALARACGIDSARIDRAGDLGEIER